MRDKASFRQFCESRGWCRGAGAGGTSEGHRVAQVPLQLMPSCSHLRKGNLSPTVMSCGRMRGEGLGAKMLVVGVGLGDRASIRELSSGPPHGRPPHALSFILTPLHFADRTRAFNFERPCYLRGGICLKQGTPNCEPFRGPCRAFTVCCKVKRS